MERLEPVKVGVKRQSICLAILVTAASICGAAVGQITSYVQINPPGGKQAGGFNVGRSTTTAICFDDGSCLSSAGGTGVPGGSPTQLQFNNSGAFGGISGTSVNGFTVNFATVTVSSGTISTLNVTSIKFPNGSIQVSSPTVSSVGGSGIVSPGTFTWTNNFGMAVSTLVISAPSYASGQIAITPATSGVAGVVDISTSVLRIQGNGTEQLHINPPGGSVNSVNGQSTPLVTVSSGNFSTGTGKLYFRQQSGVSGYVSFRASQTVTNTDYVLPNADGTSGQALTTDGAHNLSFTTIGGGGSTNGQINSSSQYSLGYYSVTGSSNVISGLTPGTSGYVLYSQGSSLPPFYGPALSTNSVILNQFSTFQTGNFTITGVGTASGGFQTNTYYDSNGNSVVADNGNSAYIFLGTGNLPSFGGGLASDVFIGALSGSATTSGHDNVCSGSNACAGMTSGNQNTAIGSNAMQISTTSTQNVFIGYNSGDKLTVGSGNVGVGYVAGDRLTSGNQNTSVGNGAGDDLIDGSFNTCVGDQPCHNVLHGSSNTMVGSESGNLTEGTNDSGNTFLGYASGVNGGAAISNSICIGINCVATSSNTARIGGTGPFDVTVIMSTMSVSSATVSGQLKTGSLQGASLATCGDTTHALAYTSGTGLFSCQSITGTGGGGGGGNTVAANQFSAPYYNVAGSSTSLAAFPGVTLSTNTGVAIATYTVLGAPGFSVLHASNTIMTGTTFYQDGTAIINGVKSSTWLTGNQSITWTGSGDVTGSASGATSISPALTLAGNQPNIKTLSASSATITGSQGLLVTYGVTASSGNLNTVQVSSNSILANTTFYKDGTAVMGAASGVTNASDYLVNISSANGTVVFGVQNSGHLVSSGTLPSVSACGTSPSIDPASTDAAGKINVGSVTATSCVLTFASPFAAAPICTVSDDSTGVTADISSISASSVTFGFSVSLASGHVWYLCFGGRGG